MDTWCTQHNKGCMSVQSVLVVLVYNIQTAVLLQVTTPRQPQDTHPRQRQRIGRPFVFFALHSHPVFSRMGCPRGYNAHCG